MKIKQLGNGGAFNFEMTNTSFLVDIDDEYTLIDCGYNVYSELRNQDKSKEIDLKKLIRVYITHMDDDHMGSLKTLIYYQYFINNIILEVVSYKEVYNSLEKYLSDIDGYIKYNEKQLVQMFRLVNLNNTMYINKNRTFGIRILVSNHFKPCYGIEFSYHDDDFFKIVFTGDTKYNHRVKDNYNNINCLIFHDYSNWNEPSQQVHCCESDFKYYSENIKKKIIKVHNDEEFNSNWMEVISEEDKLILKETSK